MPSSPRFAWCLEIETASPKWWFLKMIARMREKQKGHLKKNITYIYIYITYIACNICCKICLYPSLISIQPPHVLFDVIHHHLHTLCDCHTSTDQTDSGSTRRPLQNLQGIRPLMCFRQSWQDRKDQHLWIVHPHLLGGNKKRSCWKENQTTWSPWTWRWIHREILIYHGLWHNVNITG